MLYGEGTVLYRKEGTKVTSLNTVVLAEQNGGRLKKYITRVKCCNLNEQLLSAQHLAIFSAPSQAPVIVYGARPGRTACSYRFHHCTEMEFVNVHFL
jgi:hypothetical protein